MRCFALLALFLAVLAARPSHADWRVAETAHFIVYANASEAALRRNAERLEKFDKALRLSRGILESSLGKAGRLTVYFVGTKGRVAALAGTANVAGFYIPRAGASVAFVPGDLFGEGPLALGSQQVLQHEYAHHFLATTWSDAAFPSWVSEGWAEFHATASFDRAGNLRFGAAPLYRTRGLQTADPLPIRQILAGAAGRLRADQREALYGRGWALVHYLSFEPSRRGQLSAYLDAITKERTSPEAAAVAFGDLDALNKELERFLQQPRISGFRIRAENLVIPPVTIRPLRPGEAAILPVRIRLDAGVDDKTAPGLFADAKTIAARFPDDPEVQRVLAEAAYDAGDYAAALAVADRAIAADPDHVEAHCYRAMAQMAIAEAAKDDTPETWAEIRRMIDRAGQLDPEDPRPLILLYRSYADRRQWPPEAARKGLMHAYALAPQDRGLRMQVAGMLVGEKKLAEARAMLLVLTYDPHASGAGAAASRMIDKIDAQIRAGVFAAPAAAGAK
ncbi:tetratricopeptide (TPR) repeat protein [Sphingomonas trueperi]